jgi:hypothetical protein
MGRDTGRVMRVAMAALVLLGGTLGVAAAHAQDKPTDKPPAEPAPKGPNTGRLSLTGGFDMPTAYFFRGIRQEDDDFILQPYGELTFKLYEGEGAFNALTLTPGIWNSLHWGPTGEDGPTTTGPRAWYESDIYVRLAATFFEVLTPSVTYTLYTSPNSFFSTIQEVGFGLNVADGKFLGPFALNPSILLAFEVSGQADAGRNEGTYLQLGVAPGVTLLEKTAYPLTITFPLVLGLSLDDYYEFGTGSDDTFGFFQGGVSLSVPLAFIPASFGAWTAKASVAVLTLGDNLKRVNNRDSTEVIGTFGIAFSY